MKCGDGCGTKLDAFWGDLGEFEAIRGFKSHLFYISQYFEFQNSITPEYLFCVRIIVSLVLESVFSILTLYGK